MQAGAVGVCVQKTAEAEAMVAGGVHRRLHQQRGDRAAQAGARGRSWRTGWRPKAASWRSRWTASRACRGWRTAMNDARREAGAAAVIDVFVEIDVGQGRCGVPPGPRGGGAGARDPQAPGPALRRPAGLPRPGAAPAQRRRSAATPSPACVQDVHVHPQADRGRRHAGRPGHRRRHRQHGVRGGQRRLRRTAGRLLPVHGRRLRAPTSATRRSRSSSTRCSSRRR